MARRPDRLVVLANTKVRIEKVLTDYFHIPVPLEARSWKTTCPFSYEHIDGGLDKQFRVYSESNHAYCFDSHGVFDPVRLWQARQMSPMSARQAAVELLDAYGIEYRKKSYQERWAALTAPQAPPDARPDPDTVSAALHVFLGRQPAYRDLQFDPRVLRSVNYVLQQVSPVCERAQSPEEVREWYEQVTRSLSRLLDSLSLTP